MVCAERSESNTPSMVSPMSREQVGDSHVGYRQGQLPNHMNGDLPTTNTCRHTMQLSLLLKALRAWPLCRLFACVCVSERFVGGACEAGERRPEP